LKREFRRFKTDFEGLQERLDRLEGAVDHAPFISAISTPDPVEATLGPVSSEPVWKTDSDQTDSAGADWSVAPSIPSTEPEVGIIPEFQEPTPRDEFVEKAVAAVKGWFQGEQGVVRIGVLLLFVGVALLVKYAADHVHFGPEARLAGSIALGLAVFITGWRLRNTRRPYALTLQGGGIGILYIASFAASRLLGFMDSAEALPVLGALSASLWALAVFQESVPLAALGIVGGFLAPILLSDGSGSYLGLLSYYLILDLCILGIVWLRTWRVLGWMGFVFTLGIGATFGILRYQTTDYLGAQLLLGAFFVVFSTMGWILAKRSGRLDGALVFGTAVATTALQGALVKDFPHGLAISAAVLGTALALAAAATWKWMGREMLNLVIAWIAMGVSLSSLSIPLFFDPQVACVLWALEGVGLLWLGLRQESRLSFAGGLLLQGFSGFLFLQYLAHPPSGFPIGTLVCGVVLLVTGGISSILVERLGSEERFPLALGFAGWAVFWALATAEQTLSRELVGAAAVATTWSIAVFALAMTGSLVAMKTKWKAFQELSPLLFWVQLVPALVLISQPMASPVHPLVCLVLAALWIWLDRTQRVARICGSWSTSALRQVPIHASWLLVLTGFVLARTETSDSGLREVILAGTWISWTIPLLWGRTRGLVPFRAAPEAWRNWGFLLVLVPLWVTDLILFTDPSTLLGDGWIPLVAPTDLVGLAVPVVTVFWGLRGGPRKAIQTGIALGVVFFHVEILRGFHHWGGVEWSPGDLWASAGLQATLGLLWAATALVLMRIGHLRSIRRSWRTGAGVLAVVVAKLLFVDLSGAGTVGRIVAFIGVGLAMLLVGWIAPQPPVAELQE